MNKSVVGPAGLLLVSGLLGGWLLQEGVDRDRNLYEQARVFREVVDRVSREFVDDVSGGMLYDDAIEGIMRSLDDPNSYVFEPEGFEQFRIQTEGEYAGVGLEISPRDGLITVIAPLPGGPGAAAGIRAGDQIVVVEGESAEGWSVDRMGDALRGRPGTEVSLELRRPGVAENIPVTLRRADIQLRAVPFATILEPGIGYVPVQMFRETVTDELRIALDSLSAEGASSVILDFRGNPGGLLEEGIAMTDLFLAAGEPIVETRRREGSEIESFSARSQDQYEDLDIILLVDDRSASASEILAGALQDHDRAVLVGTRTYGKGSVQTLFPLSGGQVLKLTTARWYTPSGRSIQASDAERDEFLEGTAYTLDARRVDRSSIEGRPTFRSFGGELLYGGGGITPDEVVLPDTLTAEEVDALSRVHRASPRLLTSFFDVAVAYLQDHPDLSIDFELGEDALSELRENLTEAGVEVPDEALEAASRSLLHQMGREIALQRWGAEGEFRWLSRDDPQLWRALEIARETTGNTEVDPVGG